MRLHLIVPATALIASAVGGAPAAHAVTKVVSYECVTKATGEKQDVKVNIALTVPATAAVDVELTIGWSGSYVAGSELRAPASGLDDGVKFYAYAGISGIPGLTSATGVGELATITPGEIIALPEAVELRTTPNNIDSGSVRPMAINVGLRPAEPLIECDVLNRDALTTYPLAVTADGQPGTPDPETDAPSEETPDDETATRTVARTTPKGGADTGGGGGAGPDGRLVVLGGGVLLLASTTGLVLRRRRTSR